MENKSPLVSVGIPTYNRPEGLRRTLECITRQTYKNLEIIVSDNCSPGSETEAVAREFMEKDSRIQYFRQHENKGAFFNFKFVLEKATAEYFMWAADDDEWDLRFVEVCLEKLTCNKGYGVVFTRYIITAPHGEKKFWLNHNLYLKSKYKKLVFLFLDECLSHKANIIYGIWRTEIIKTVLSYNFKEEYVGKGLDGAMVLHALDITDAYQVQEILFKKKYSAVIPGSIRAIMLSTRQNLISAIINPFSHFKRGVAHTKQFIEIIAPFYTDHNKIVRSLIFFVKGTCNFIRNTIF